MTRGDNDQRVARRRKVALQMQLPNDSVPPSEEARRVDTSTMIKPELDRETVASFLATHFGAPVDELTALTAGEISCVYAFIRDGQPLIVRFATGPGGFLRDRLAADLLAPLVIPVPRILDIGRFGPLTFALSEQVPGDMLSRLSSGQHVAIMPEVAAVMSHIHQVDLGERRGYGPVDDAGHGQYTSWPAFLRAFMDQDQPGFWHGWHHLFDTTVLERSVVDRLYARMTTLLWACPTERTLVHGDCHHENILVQDGQVTGIIDWAGMAYGDGLYDVATLHLWTPRLGTGYPDTFRDHYAALGSTMPYMEERLLCYTYRHGLDALRFFAKKGDDAAYQAMRDHLLTLPG